MKKISRKIVAIGGGHLNKQNNSIIENEILSLVDKKDKKVLFISTASNDNESYKKCFFDFFTNLNCSVDFLCLYEKNLTYKEIEKKINATDIIYVGGGNTLKMMTLWRKLKIDTLLKKAWINGIVMSGISAGAICWFNHGNSDSRKFNNPNAKLIKVTALGFINCFFCPHFNSEDDRKSSLKEMMKKEKTVAIACDDHAAIEIVDDTYRIITREKNSFAYKIYWKNNVYHEEKLLIDNDYRSLKELLKF